jgi:hypothetical protein
MIIDSFVEKNWVEISKRDRFIAALGTLKAWSVLRQRIQESGSKPTEQAFSESQQMVRLTTLKKLKLNPVA